ncbi:DNA translocase FtsK [Streptosporangium sp. NPDC048865]|uniref:DNA translocase FtsK n=1 Tax=Streptosporangium sp. NPDC048865 TaxID=3155766 RepID=UPI00344316CB
MTDTLTTHDLADSLRAATADLNAYIERRAQEIAAPRIAQAEADAAARIAELESTAAAERQRHEDLLAEMRRQFQVTERRHDQLWWVAQYLPEPLRLLVRWPGPIPGTPPTTLSPEWLAQVARRAHPNFTLESEYELRMLVQAVELVVRSQSTARFQQKMRVGFAKAGALLDQLEVLGVVGPHRDKKPRQVLAKREDLSALVAKISNSPVPERIPA